MAWDDWISALAKEDSAAALLAALGGISIQYDAQRDALRRQQQAIAAAQAEQAAMQQRRQAQVVDMARRYTPEATTQQLDQVIAPQQQRLEGVAQQAATQMGTAPTPAGASSRYTVAMGQRATDELRRAIAEAGMAARAGGGQRLMFEQGLTQAQGASDLDSITSAMRSAARASENRIARAGQVSPGRMFWGGALTTLPAFAQYLSRKPGLRSGLAAGTGGATGLLPPSGNAGLRPRGGIAFGPAFPSELG